MPPIILEIPANLVQQAGSAVCSASPLLRTVTNRYLAVALGLSLTSAVTQVVKITVGRPRPGNNSGVFHTGANILTQIF